jgi:hypothetical protein
MSNSSAIIEHQLEAKRVQPDASHNSGNYAGWERVRRCTREAMEAVKLLEKGGLTSTLEAGR